VAARRRGLRVPEELSVVGFDGLPAARWAPPNRVELSTELIIGASTAAPRGSSHTLTRA
jgi:LacI family transcriptional regulator